MSRILSARTFMDPDGTWTVEIPERTSRTPRGAEIVATGSVTTFRCIRRAASDLASAWLDVDPAEIALEISVVAPDEVVQLVRASDQAEDEGNAARARGAALRREAAHALREKSCPLEAAAAVIDVSYQRVQQLAS